MPSFTTVFRAMVMIVVGGVVVKGWHLYGPTNEQVKSAAVRAVEVAQATLQNFQQQEGSNQQAADPRAAAPGFGNANQTAGADPAAPPLPPGQTLEPPALATGDRYHITPGKTSQLATGETDRMPRLMSRLEQLGAVEPKLAPWGNDGRLHRFCCRASLASSPAMTQHFEAVAGDPLAAVEQVVAKVEAWRLAQQAQVNLAHASDERLGGLSR